MYLYALRAITNRTEEAIGLLRYLLGGDRPSQTDHLTLSPIRIHGYGLEHQHGKSGISPVTPRRLAPPAHSLPLILHMPGRYTMIGYSKGPRGLSVFLRVNGIFTATSISPSPSLRQCPSRYAIRAGRNLPDKELRYLRTLIVRAAIHRSLSFELLCCQRLQITLPLDLPASGRRQSVYVVLRLCTDLCF